MLFQMYQQVQKNLDLILLDHITFVTTSDHLPQTINVFHLCNSENIFHSLKDAQLRLDVKNIPSFNL